MYEAVFCIAYLLITWAGFDAIENFARRQAPPTGKTDVFFRNRFRNGAVSILGSGVAYALVPELLNVKNHWAAPAFIFGSLVLWRWAVRAEWNSATPKHRQVLMLTDLGRVFLQIWSSNAAGAVAQNDESRFAISVAGYLATLAVVSLFLKPASHALLRQVGKETSQADAEVEAEFEAQRKARFEELRVKEEAERKIKLELVRQEEEALIYRQRCDVLRQHNAHLLDQIALLKQELQEKQESEGPQDSR